MTAIDKNGKLFENPAIKSVDEMDLSIARSIARRKEVSKIGKELSDLSASLKTLLS